MPPVSHGARAGIEAGMNPGDIGHPAECMAGIDRHRPAKPGELLRRRDPLVEGGGLIATAPVLPYKRRKERLAGRVDEDVGTHLRAKADTEQAAEVVSL